MSISIDEYPVLTYWDVIITGIECSHFCACLLYLCTCLCDVCVCVPFRCPCGYDE